MVIDPIHDAGVRYLQLPTNPPEITTGNILFDGLAPYVWTVADGLRVRGIFPLIVPTQVPLATRPIPSDFDLLVTLLAV